MPTVMVDFIYQPDWAMGYLDSWQTLFYIVSVRIFLDDINIKSLDLNKADCLP